MAKTRVISLFKNERFENRFPNIKIIGRAINIFVKCKAYELQIPIIKSKVRVLDIFEEAVLRIINIGINDVEKISDILCFCTYTGKEKIINTDIVNLVLIKLSDKGYIDQDKKITDEGKEKINLRINEKKEIQYIPATCFLIKDSDIILPYIQIGEFKTEKNVSIEEDKIYIQYGTAGDSTIIKGKYIGERKKEKRTRNIFENKNTLEQNKIRKSIKTYNLLAQKREELSEIDYDLRSNNFIYSTSSEDIFFHFKAFIQEGNADDVLFSDGLISNVDGIFSYVNKIDWNFIDYVRKKNVSLSKDDGNEDLKQEQKNKRYYSVVKYYDDIQKNTRDKIQDSKTKDEKEKILQDNKKAIKDCYSMLEWGFYYYNKNNMPSDILLDLFRKQTSSSNMELFLKFANDIGIKNVESYKHLFSLVDQIKIQIAYKMPNPIPMMNVCLPLAIAEATENKKSNIYELVKKEPDFLSFLNDLKYKSNSLRHDLASDVLGVKIGETVDKSRKIIEILLPDITFNNETSTQSKIISASEVKLSAQVRLERDLGSVIYQTLSDDVKNEWLKIDPNRRQPDSLEYILIISRLMENLLSEEIKEIFGISKDKQYTIKKLTSKIGKELPNSLKKVYDGYFIEASRKQKSTLGAYTLVFFANCEDDIMFKKLLNIGFISFIDEIITLRTHGNNVGLQVDAEKLKDFREKAIKATKIIGGANV